MRLLLKLKNELSNLLLRLKALFHKPSIAVVHNVDFISQFANPNWAEKVLKDGWPKTSDPDWTLSGATALQEYEKWVTTICGMACTAMALKYFYNQNHQTITLASDALQKKVYREAKHELSDMHYNEYVTWIAGYHMSATSYSRLSLSGIRHILSKGGLAIVSVSPNIRGYQTAPLTQYGGHLILVTGYSDASGTITIQNPSGFVSQNTHHNHTLSYKNFSLFFAGRGIAVFKQ